MFVRPHPAILIGPINAFQGIAGTLEETCSFEILPLAVKIFQRCNVGLPGFYVSRIHGNLLLLVGVFISKACEGMSELMNDHRLERRVVGHTQIVTIEDSSAAIVVRIDQDDDMLVGSTCKPIM